MNDTADTNSADTSMKNVRAIGVDDLVGEKHRGGQAADAAADAQESLFANWSSSQIQEFDRLVYELTQTKRRLAENHLLTGYDRSGCNWL